MFFRHFNKKTLNATEPQVGQFWLLIAAVLTWLLTVPAFSAAFPDQTSTAFQISAATGILGIFASIKLRELMRSKVAHHLITGTLNQSLLQTKRNAPKNKKPLSAASEFRIAIVGPLTSFTLAIILAIGFVLVDRFAPGTLVPQLLAYLSVISLALALITLIPAFPFDGGHLLRAVLWRSNGDFASATKITEAIGRVLSVGLVLTGLVTFIWGFLSVGLGQILLGCFLGAVARMQRQKLYHCAPLADQTVAHAMSANPITVSPEMTLSHIVNQVVLRHGVNFLPVVENGILLGKIDKNLLSSIDREYWSSTKADDIFVALSGDTLLSATTPVSAVLDLIIRTGQRKFLVVEGQSLVGVLTLADLILYLLLA